MYLKRPIFPSERSVHSWCTFLFLVKLSARVPHPSGGSFVRHRRPGARLFHILHRMRCTVNASLRSVSITQPAISIEHLQIKPTIISLPLCKILNSHRKVIFVYLNDPLFIFYRKLLQCDINSAELISLSLIRLYTRVLKFETQFSFYMSNGVFWREIWITDLKYNHK